jgi:two-component system, NtrC family, response regulator AtoC
MGVENQGRTILVADDEAESRNFLATALRYQGFGVELAENGHEVLDCLAANSSLTAVLLDVVMPGKDGIQTLREIRARDIHLPVIMLSGAATTGRIVEAMKCGATDFLGKPLGHDDLRVALRNALERRVAAPRPGRREAETTSEKWCPRVQELYAMAAQVGASEAPVLIQGETGSGKEVLARHVHAHSRRANRPFLKLNCAALPSELVESELFGYERGAFTGAFQRKPGMFEIADGGTLLLDEIGDMDFKLQAKLLQVLQDHEFQRLGGKETVRVDVRVIAATHKDLEKAMAANQFRQDLYYRLNVVTLQVPPLRERKEDIVALTEILIQKYAGMDSPPPPITPALQQALLMHDWPGNVRELENAVRKLLVLQDPDMIVRDLNARAARKALATAPVLDLPAGSEPAEVSAPILEQVTRAKHQAETEAILAALGSTHWNRKKAAALLKIDYKALLYKMKKLGIEDKMASMPATAEAPSKEKVMSAGSGQFF